MSERDLKRGVPTTLSLKNCLSDHKNSYKPTNPENQVSLEQVT